LWQSINYGHVVKATYPSNKLIRFLVKYNGIITGIIQGSYSKYFGFGMCLDVRNGPIIIDEDNKDIILNDILTYLDDYCNKKKIIEVQIRWPEIWGNSRQFYGLSYKNTGRTNEYYVKLFNEPDNLWKKIDRNKRKNIRKAIREKLTVIEAHDSKNLKIFYDMLRASVKRHDFFIDPLSWYETIWDYFEPGKYSRIFFTKWDDRLVSGVFTINFGRTIYALVAGSFSEAWKVRPNDLLHWKVMEWGCERDYARYYMGLVDDPVPNRNSNSWGIWRWKKEWNGELRKIILYNKVILPKYNFIVNLKRVGEKLYKKIIHT